MTTACRVYGLEPLEIPVSRGSRYLWRFIGGCCVVYAPFNDTYFSALRFQILNSLPSVFSADSSAGLLALTPKVLR